MAPGANCQQRAADTQKRKRPAFPLDIQVHSPTPEKENKRPAFPLETWEHSLTPEHGTRIKLPSNCHQTAAARLYPCWLNNLPADCRRGERAKASMSLGDIGTFTTTQTWLLCWLNNPPANCQGKKQNEKTHRNLKRIPAEHRRHGHTTSYSGELFLFPRVLQEPLARLGIPPSGA